MTSSEVDVETPGSPKDFKPSQPVMATSPRALLRRHPVLATFALALAVRTVLAMIIWVRYGGSLFADEETYSALAAQMADGDTAGWSRYLHFLYGATRAFLLPLTAIYRVTGEVMIFGQLLVAFVGALAAAGTTVLARRVVTHGWAWLAGAIVALFPSQILWSSITLKDAFVWAAMVAIAIALSGSREDISWRQVFGVLVALVSLAYLRQHTLIIAAWSVVLAVALVPRRGRWAATAALVICALVVPAMVDLGPGGWTFVRNSGSLETKRALNAIGAETALVEPIIAADMARQEAAAAEARAAAATEAAMESDAEEEARRLRAEARELARMAARLRIQAARAEASSSPLVADAFGGEGKPLPEGLGSTLRYLPTGVAVMLLEPYPWASAKNRSIQLARLESLVWYPLLVLALIGVATAWRRRDVFAFPLLVGGGSMLVSAVSQGNFGTAYRHRGEFVWVVALFAVVGARWLADRRRSTQSLAVTGRHDRSITSS